MSTEKKYEEINLKFPEQAIVTHVGMSKDGGEFDIIGREHPLIPKLQYIKPTSVELIAYYSKEKKSKVLYRYLLLDSYSPGNIHWAMNAWSHFFAIDTNTRDIDGVRVSITAVIYGCIKGTENGEGVYKFDTYYTEANPNVPGNPETYAICKLISKIQKDYKFDLGMKFGIITDSDMSLIDAYNSRTKCLLPVIFPGLYLPSNFQIMYAAADRARDTYMPNKMMGMCDSAAASAFNSLEIKRV